MSENTSDEIKKDCIVDDKLEENLQDERYNEKNNNQENNNEQNLKDELKQAQESAKDNYDKLIRLQADMENLRRRNAKDIENAHKFALEKFAKSLLDVADSMVMGLKSANDENTNIDSIKDGIKMTNKIFIDVLAKFNINAINPQNEELNPEKHEAISMIPNSDVKSNTIIEVVQTGWELGGRVLRPAMVVVAQ